MSSSSTAQPTLGDPRSVPQARHSDEPTVLEMLESLLLLITGAVVAAPMLPGFTLCIPVLVLLTVAVLAPVVVAAALVSLVGVVVAIPFLLVRSVRSIRSRRAAVAPVPTPVPATGSRAAGETLRLPA